MAGCFEGAENQWEWSSSTWKEKMGKLLSTGFQSDLTIILPGPNEDKKVDVHVHKIFLQCGSRVLNSKIGNSELELDDVQDYDSFMKMMKFFYTGDSGVTIHQALPLLKMATDFEVVELRDQCATLLKGNITLDNVLPIFEDAMKYGHKDLIGATLKFICHYARNILNTPGFSNLRLECLIEIIQQDDLMVKEEMEVFNAVYDWAKAESERQGSESNEGIRRVIDKPLKYVRFPLMDKEQFSLHVATKNLLNHDEAMGLLMCFLVAPENRPQLPQGRFISTPRKYFQEILGWEISRRQFNLVHEFEDASTVQETMCFYIEGLYSLKLKEVVFPKGILLLTTRNSTWREKCGYNHEWRTPIQVQCTLSSSEGQGQVVQKTSQALLQGHDESYHVPIIGSVRANVLYKFTAKFHGKSHCSRRSVGEFCPYSWLEASVKDKSSRSQLQSVRHFHDPSTTTLRQAIPIPGLKFIVGREEPMTDPIPIPITSGFIVFDVLME